MTKALVILLPETDRWNEIPLYEAVVRRLNHLEISGASVFRGIMGFGATHHVHSGHLFGVSDDRPVSIWVIDTEERLRAAVPELRKMAPNRVMMLMDVEPL
jgi:PII-like signaling protein